jgi:phage baseplate assembly protein W
MAIKRVLERQKFQQGGGPSEIYSDFLHTFLPHPATGQISRKTNVDAVKMSIRNLVLTDKYERLKNPRIGANIRRHLFELFTPMTAEYLKNDIRQTIEQNEPRARILQLNVTPNEDQNEMRVNLLFSIVTSQEPQQLELTLYRVR